MVPREPPHAGAVAARRRSAAATSLAERSKGGGGATDAGAPLPLGWAGGQKGAMGAGMVRKGRELVVVSREARRGREARGREREREGGEG